MLAWTWSCKFCCRHYSHAGRDLIPASVKIKLDFKCFVMHKLALLKLLLIEFNTFEGKQLLGDLEESTELEDTDKHLLCKPTALYL